MLGWELFNYKALEFYGKTCYLKGGLVFADALTTVSRRYAEEIRTPAFGCGLEGVLEERAADLHGILNGVDYAQWDPARDPHIAAPYDAGDLAGKAACKADLQAAYGLPKADVPLIGMISRLADQKGFDLVAEIGDRLAGLKCQLVILGSGERRHQEYATALRDRHPSQVGVVIGFDEALAHKIEAGCDLFLMPSRYEPCGLNQMYSLRYGTVPVVRAVGGLDDTIEEHDAAAGTGNGFKFEPYTGAALYDAVKRALDAYRKRPAWRALMARGMAQDFSWDASARKYAALYARLTGKDDTTP
jgi:starch synthase